MDTLAERLTYALSQSGLKQKDLVLATSAKPSSVSLWLNGKTKELRGDNLQNAAKALGVSTDWLGSGVGAMERDGATVPQLTLPELMAQLTKALEQAPAQNRATVAAVMTSLVNQPSEATAAFLVTQLTPVPTNLSMETHVFAGKPPATLPITD